METDEQPLGDTLVEMTDYNDYKETNGPANGTSFMTRITKPAAWAPFHARLDVTS